MASSTSRAREKEDRVVAQRLAGYSFEEIARAVGYQHKSGAWKAYKRAMERRSDPVDAGANVREDEINLELLRLDEMQAALWPRAQRGDLAAHDRILKIMDRRDKLRHRYHVAQAQDLPGADASTKGEVVVPRTKLDELREKRRAGD